jgi:hypothetical protein
MQTTVDEGNPAIVKIGCAQCPSNLMYNPTKDELTKARVLVGKMVRCQKCGTVWYLNGMEVRQFVTAEGDEAYVIPFWIPTVTKDTPIHLESMMQDTFEAEEESAGNDSEGEKVQEQSVARAKQKKKTAK